MEATYRVAGMTCGGCARSVTNALHRAAPDAQVEVSVDQGLVSVRGTVDEAAVRAAVEDAGFEFRGRAEPAAG